MFWQGLVFWEMLGRLVKLLGRVWGILEAS
jgi:hypothetical protein